MSDTTLLIAHADDECIFLWPFLPRVKRIVCASSDLHNLSRAWCKERRYCLEEVGKLIGAEVVCLDHDSEFYRLPTRTGELKRLAQTLIDLLRGDEIIATHNAFGEYGHLDHILIHHIARTLQAQTKCRLLVTDIAQEINWLPVRPWKQADDSRLMMTNIEPKRLVFELDRPLYDAIKRIYDRRGCWTWSFPVVEKCGVYSL